MRLATLRPATSRATRPASLLLVVAMMASLVGVWGAPHADATSYRFWSYWVGGSDWTFSSQGAARRPADGSVDGWRFAVSPASSSTIPPRHSPTFDSLCGRTPAQDGKKRVGLVVDPGVSGDAPGGEAPPPIIATCAVVPQDANGYDVLMTVATLRSDKGLVCGINGYPATECGAPVADPTPSRSDDPTGPGGSSSSGNSGGDDNGGGDDATAGGQGNDTKAGSADDKGASKGTRDNDAKREKGAEASGPTGSDDTDDTVVAASTTSSPASPSSGSPVGVLIGLVVIAAVGAVALVVRRRRA